MGFDKLTADLNGEPVVAVSLRAFEACPAVERIVLVVHPERCEEFHAIASQANISKLSAVVPGGGERHLSVWNGIEAAAANPDQHLAVHDAARPLVTPAAIEACYDLARHHGAATCAIPVADTLKRASRDRFVEGTVDREHLWAMQTPQIFLANLLSDAYRSLLKTNTVVTDEVSAVQRLGVSVALCPTQEVNFKITFPHDLELARLVLAARASL